MLHGIKEITFDNKGYIYWLGNCIYLVQDPLNDDMAVIVHELNRRCNILNQGGREINACTVIWLWDFLLGTDKWDVYFKGCKATAEARYAAKRICKAYNLFGLGDPGFIAQIISSVIDSEI